MRKDTNYVQIHYLSDEIKKLETTYLTEDNQILVFFAPKNILKQLPKVTLDNIGRYVVYKLFREIDLKYLNQYVGPIKRLVVWKLKSEPTLRLGYLGTMFEVKKYTGDSRIIVRFESFRINKKVWNIDLCDIDKIWRLGS